MSNEKIKSTIISLISEINSILEELQKKHIQSAHDLGVTRENFNNLIPFFLNNNLNSESDYLPFLSIAKDYLTSFRDQVQAHGHKAEVVFNDTNPIMASGVAFTTSTGTAWSIIDHDSYPENKIIFPQNQHTRDYYYSKFTQIDASLGRTYKEIDEIIHTTLADPERAALFMARQSFDHFFDAIAPDEDVRKSSYWREKESFESKDTNTVWRIEKIEYAINKHITDPLKAQNLVDQSKYILETYRLLNKAHTRGEIDIQEANNLIISMKTILEEWVVALDSK